jgi:hypothetical protein
MIRAGTETAAAARVSLLRVTAFPGAPLVRGIPMIASSYGANAAVKNQRQRGPRQS